MRKQAILSLDSWYIPNIWRYLFQYIPRAVPSESLKIPICDDVW
jgi:hypothetical protein